MMKNLSLILNIVLLAAVGYLYYNNFSGKKAAGSFAKNAESKMNMDSNCSRSPIAYVEMDSLMEKISYIKDKRKELEAEQKNIETERENSYRALQQQKDDFLKKGASITQEEAEKFQTMLLQQQQQIEDKKQNASQHLNEKNFSFMDDIQKKLKEFLNDYNRDKKYMYILTTGTGLDYMVYKDSTLNITNDVIKGMNEKMKLLSKQ